MNTTRIQATAIILGFPELVRRVDAGNGFNVDAVEELAEAGALFYLHDRPSLLEGQSGPGEAEVWYRNATFGDQATLDAIVEELREIVRTADRLGRVIWSTDNTYHLAALNEALAGRGLPVIEMPYPEFAPEHLEKAITGMRLGGQLFVVA